jgi:Putative Flp pilus-assembly TadE/G-like
MTARRLRSERGSVLVLVAAAAFPLMLLLAFAIDAPHWFDYSRNLQNRADAAALAAGDQFSNLCAGNPSDPNATPELPIGQMAQLFSGPTGSASDLPYSYGSPLAAFPQFGGYQNVPNLFASNDTTGSHYHLRLNADNYATSGGTNFAIGDFCHGDPTLDKTDKECYGSTKPLQGQLAKDCAMGAMVDAKVTQDSVPLFLPFVSQPNITAHARVTVQGIGSSTNLKPLGVRDPGAIPCIQVKFIPTGGTGTPPATQTLQLTLDNSLTGTTGPVFWDNSTSNGGSGDAVTVPSGWNLYMQTILYAEGSSGTCSTMSNLLTYEQSSGILFLNSYPQSSLGTLSSGAAPQVDTGGVTLGGSCSHDQYFSSGGACAVSVTANIAFAGDAGSTSVWAVDTNTGTSIPLGPTGNTWTGSALTAAASSGQHPICIQTMQTGGSVPQSTLSTCPTYKITGSKSTSGTCTSAKPCYVSLGQQQQTFAACDENFNSACGGDPNISGPIIAAYVTEGANSTVGAFQAGTHNLVVTLQVRGLQDSPRSDRCANGPTQCTLLRVDQGNADGMVDCGEGNGAGGNQNGGRLAVLFGCPLYGQTPTPTNPVSCDNSSSEYCGGWIPTPDGSCNNATRTPTSYVDCVNTNNQGAKMPECIQALVVAGGSGQTPGTIDYSLINTSNCHVTGSTCSDDEWLLKDSNGNPVPLSADDPRVIQTFILFSGDIVGANGNTDLPIRTFASFYVTGWQFNGGGQQVTCSGNGANEPAPSNLKSTDNAIWGHWFTYTVPGAGGNGETCNFNAFGDCAAVLTR